MERSFGRNEGRENRDDPAEVTTINIPTFAGVDIGEMRKMKPRRLRQSAGEDFCCISRVPRSLLELNAEAYLPRIVSIGPYHRGLAETKMIEEHKWRYLDSLLRRLEMGPGAITFSYLLKQLAQMEKYARDCCSEEIGLGSDEFSMMMLLDGCFIVELLLRYGHSFEIEQEDPIFNCPWILPLILRDLIKLENQLPFFVLQLIFDLSTLDDSNSRSLSALALDFFCYAMPRPPHVIRRCASTDEYLHLLDLFRDSFIPLQVERPRENSSADVIDCATRLVKAGIKFKPVDQAESFLEISFKNGVLNIPTVKIDFFHASFLTNCVAFEQSYHYTFWYFTAYVTFLDRLIDTERDVALLIDKKVVSNFLGSEKEVAKFYNDIGRDMIIDIKRCYLSKQFEEVRKYYSTTRHFFYHECVSRYFSSPLACISAFAALLLLCLTIAQTVFGSLGVRSHH